MAVAALVATVVAAARAAYDDAVKTAWVVYKENMERCLHAEEANVTTTDDYMAHGVAVYRCRACGREREVMRP